MTVVLAILTGMLGFLVWGILLAVLLERGHPDYDGMPTMTFSALGWLLIVAAAVASVAVLVYSIATSASAMLAGFGFGAAAAALAMSVYTWRMQADTG